MNLNNNGITSFSCLNKGVTLNVFNNEKYWKEGEKEEFLNRITRSMDENYAKEGICNIYS